MMVRLLKPMKEQIALGIGAGQCRPETGFDGGRGTSQVRYVMHRRSRSRDALQPVTNPSKYKPCGLHEPISDLTVALVGDALQREAREMDQGAAQPVLHGADRNDVAQHRIRESPVLLF